MPPAVWAQQAAGEVGMLLEESGPPPQERKALRAGVVFWAATRSALRQSSAQPGELPQGARVPAREAQGESGAQRALQCLTGVSLLTYCAPTARR